MMIADDSPKALKIINGYDYTINDKGDLIIGGLGKRYITQGWTVPGLE